VINYKQEAFPDGAAVLDIERGQLDASRKLFWQTDTSVSIKSWGYIKNDTFRTPESMIQQLVDIVSKNGCLLLNIGPKSDGTIPDEAQQILLSMGRWLKVNGEAIYRTRPWKTYGEGPTHVAGGAFHDTATKAYSSRDIRFTTNGDTLYAIAMAWPEDGKLVIRSIGPSVPVKSVHLLGSDAEIKWTRAADGLTLQLPARKTGEFAYAFKIEPK
jgi:alpha-L-fucosidase